MMATFCDLTYSCYTISGYCKICHFFSSNRNKKLLTDEIYFKIAQFSYFYDIYEMIFKHNSLKNIYLNRKYLWQIHYILQLILQRKLKIKIKKAY